MIKEYLILNDVYSIIFQKHEIYRQNLSESILKESVYKLFLIYGGPAVIAVRRTNGRTEDGQTDRQTD